MTIPPRRETNGKDYTKPSPYENVRQRNYWEDRIDGEDLSEQAESWMDRMDPEDTQSGTVYCGHCGSHMHVELLGSQAYQATCSHCGTSGPRADSRSEAFQLASELFPD